jgi:8-oxo-dGTP pyrophosphatase MutT (NUDIX family)
MTSVSCGTLVLNEERKILLCHVTHTRHWDIPKGLQDPGEEPLEAALRELREEAGLVLEAALLQDLGSFTYRPDKRLHLFRAELPAGACELGDLACTSFFPHHATGKQTPEVDGFMWATRDEVRTLCWPRMAGVLLSLDW